MTPGASSPRQVLGTPCRLLHSLSASACACDRSLCCAHLSGQLHSTQAAALAVAVVTALWSHEWGAPQISDFGLSHMYANGPILTKTVGTVCYAAPELLTSGMLTRAADVYSFGAPGLLGFALQYCHRLHNSS